MNEILKSLIQWAEEKSTTQWAEEKSTTQPKRNKQSQKNVCSRRAIQKILRDYGITVVKIGELTNCDHSSVLMQLKRHMELYDNYEFYRKIYDFMKLHKNEILEYYKMRLDI